MTQLIEDYALIGNNATTALVGRNGSIDWLGFPRFDSPACFAALLGSHENGHWRIAPKSEHPEVKRKYREGTLVLETEFNTPEGTVVLVDCMDRRGEHQDVLRLLRCTRGRVPMIMQLVIRFDYGMALPWFSRLEEGRYRAVAGPDQLILTTAVPIRGEDFKTRANFEIAEGEEIPFSLTWSHSSEPPAPSPNVSKSIESVAHSWERWSRKYKGDGPWSEAVLRSLITLKALTHHRSGGIVAAATTSLPEEIGGVRNWDYRYCWLRDATFTLYALMENGYIDEATQWRDWLLRAVGGSPDKMQIMYGVDGERRLTEFELPELLGYESSRPVRIGNAASEQFQLDVWGEVIDSLYQGQKRGLPTGEAAWSLQRALIGQVEKVWFKPDDGIWEIRGPRRHFVHSKVMAWVAVDRAIRSVQEFQCVADDDVLERWIALRGDIHDEVCRLGYSHEVNSFVQYFGGKQLDASLLLLPLVGFLPPEDPRIINTIAAVEKYLLKDGFVARYNSTSGVDGLPGTEGAFLACSFWLVDNYILQNRHAEANELFDRLLAVRNDVGLLSEEYDPRERRQLGNFPQAFSHLSLVNTVQNIIGETKPAKHRAGRHNH